VNVHLSFVIPALNEAHYIGAAVDSVHAAMRDWDRQCDYEIIVVDDDSSDSTVAVARQHRARVVGVCKRNIAAVRNAGGREARGKFLIFVDADTTVSPSLVREANDALTKGATWGTACAVPADKCPLWARLGLAAYNHFYVHLRKCGYGFFFFVTNEAFQQIGGFPEETQEGEDMALSKLLVRQHGPPSVLRSRVATSARKAQRFGFWYHVKMLWLTVRYGDKAYSRPEIATYRDGELRVRSAK